LLLSKTIFRQEYNLFGREKGEGAYGGSEICVHLNDVPGIVESK
jgi:hypothetical protein